MQYNISDSQGLFRCFVLIILRMASLDTLLLCSACPTLFLALFLFFFQRKWFCSHKIPLIKKQVYIHKGKRQLFSEFFSFRKSIPPTVWVESKRFYFIHRNMYISLDKLLRNQKWINEPFELKDLWRQSVTKSPKPLPLSQRYPFLIWQSSCFCLWLSLTYEN